jgi:hypothetical protein
LFGYEAAQPYSHSLRAGAAAALAITAFQVAIGIWATVGILRSANRHTSRGGSLFWANAARMLVLIGVVVIALSLSASIINMTLMARIAAGHDPDGVASVESTRNGATLVLRGRIGGGSANALQAVLDATPNTTALVLDSPGGRMTEAADIAGRVKQRHLDTAVVNQCFSACTIIFMAGAHRSAALTATFGFHQPFIVGQGRVGQWVSTQHMREYYRSAGLRDWFVDHVIAIQPKDLWVPTRRELEEAGVLTRP